MNWKLTEDRPIWVQLTEQLTLRIVSGGYVPGAPVPAVRRVSTSPRFSSSLNARCMVFGLTPASAASARTAGTGAPGT